MAIIRANHDKNYTVINNFGLQDERLAWKTRGLLCYMLSLPDDWVFRDLELTTHAPDGKQSTRNALKELEQYGYLVKQQSRGERGKFATNDWLLYEVPLTVLPITGNPPTVKPITAKPIAENQTLLSTDLPSTNLTKKNIVGQEKPDIIPYQEITEYLNQKTGKNFKHSSVANKKIIKARWNEGYRLDDFHQVIDNKVEDWKDKTFKDGTYANKYLQPSTLFGNKFDQYLNQQQIIKHQNNESNAYGIREDEFFKPPMGSDD